MEKNDKLWTVDKLKIHVTRNIQLELLVLQYKFFEKKTIKKYP